MQRRRLYAYLCWDGGRVENDITLMIFYNLQNAYEKRNLELRWYLIRYRSIRYTILARGRYDIRSRALKQSEGDSDVGRTFC